VSGLDLRPCRSDYNELAFEKSLFSGELVTSLRRHAPPNPIWRLASNDSPHYPLSLGHISSAAPNGIEFKILQHFLLSETFAGGVTSKVERDTLKEKYESAASRAHS